MKRFLLFLIEIFVASACLNAQNVNVLLKDGTEISGELISYSESILVIEPNAFIKHSKRLNPKGVTSFEIDGVGRFFSNDEKFILDESTVKKYSECSHRECGLSAYIGIHGCGSPREPI